MPVDFVPSVCAGTNIFLCFTKKDCDMVEFVQDLANPLDIAAPFDFAFGDLINISAELEFVNACIIAGVTAAFAAAGEPLPTIPTPPPPFDPTSITDQLSDMQDEITTPLGILDSTFTLEDDGTKITRIQSA
jgi:hypothetical protein